MSLEDTHDVINEIFGLNLSLIQRRFRRQKFPLLDLDLDQHNQRISGRDKPEAISGKETSVKMSEKLSPKI